MIKVRVKSFECATPCLIIDHLIQHTWSVVVKVEPLEILSRPRPLLYLHLVSKYKQCCQLVVQKIVELDWVYPNSKTRRILAIFETRTWKNPISIDCQNPNSKKKPGKLKLDQIHFWTIENFAKKMHFGQILVKMFSQTCKFETSPSFEPIFSNPKN